MRRATAALILVCVPGCAASSQGAPSAAAPKSPAKNTDGCGLARQALGEYSDTLRAMQDKTATIEDSASGFGKVSGKFGDVALIAAADLAPHARAASVSAGRLRVALTGQGDGVDVSAEAATLRTEAAAVDTYCAG